MTDATTGVTLRSHLVNMQVCVPADWTLAQIESFANTDNPTGIQSRWKIAKTGHEILAGTSERVECAQDPAKVHVMLIC